MKHGLNHGPEIQRHETTLSIQELEKQKAINMIFPQISATIKVGYLDDHVTGRSRVANVVTTLNGKIEETEFDVNRVNRAKHTNTLSFDFKQMLFDNRVIQNIRLQRRLLNKETLELIAKKTAFVLSIVEHYWTLQLLDITIKHDQERIQRKQQLLKSLNYKVNKGLIDKNILDMTNLELKTLLYDIDHKQASFRNKLHDFKELIGLPTPIEWQNDTTHPINIEDIKNRLNGLALNPTHNIQTQIIDKKIEASDTSLDIIRGNGLPTSYLLGGLEFFGEDPLDVTNSFKQFYSGTHYLAILFSLDINTFFSFGQHNYSHDILRKKISLLVQKRKQLQEDIAKNIQSLQLELQKTINDIALANELITIQERSLKKVENLYTSQISSKAQLNKRKEALSDAKYRYQQLLIKSEIILSKLFAINGNIDDYFYID